MAGQRGHRGGLYHALFMKRNSLGYPVGMAADPESISNGTTMHAHRLIAPISAGPLQLSRGSILWYGGMGVQGRQPTGISDLATFDMQLTAHDETLHAAITRTAIDEAIASDYPVIAANIGQTVPVEGMLILSVGEKPIGGNQGFRHFMYPNAILERADAGEGNQNTGTNPMPSRFRVTVDLTTRTPFGLLLEDTALQVENDIDGLLEWRTRFPIHITSHKSVADATSFALGYRPINSEHAGAKNVFTKNGEQAHTSVSGVNLTSGAITTSAQVAADFWVAVYETLYRAVA